MNSNGAPVSFSQMYPLLAAGFQALEARRQEINDLNVYPVPDGDTGTNLAATMRAILDGVAQLPETVSKAQLCTTVSQAALMGARGNSGVILSQIVRGAMEVLGEADTVTNRTLTDLLEHASETAYRAVRRPVEGTMLTVLREMAEAAALLPEDAERGTFVDQVVSAGWKSVEKTPTLLKVLADAGVVDAGGYGLVVLVEGAACGGGDWDTPIATRLLAAPAVDSSLSGAGLEEEEESEFTYCVSFLVSGSGLDRGSLEEFLGRLGDSLLVVGDTSRLKVHVHTDHPGEALNLGVARGVLSGIEIDNMKEQMEARSRRLAEAEDTGETEAPLTQVVAVVAGEGNKALFSSLGVEFIVDGGQSMNPSTEDLVRAVERATAPSVVVLPNNANVIMAAEQTQGLTGRVVHVVPSRSMLAGLSAAVLYDRRESGAKNADEMEAALERVVTGEITVAVRKSHVDGIKVKAGDFIGLVEEQVVVASSDMQTVVDAVVARLLDGGREMLTALLGEGDDAGKAAKAVEETRGRYPGVEIEIHEGGQPYYPVLLSAE